MTKETTEPVNQVQPSALKKWWHFKLSLAGGLAVLIAAACVIVTFGYMLYWNNSNRKYDIDRGGAQNQNQALSVDDSETNTIAPVDAPATKNKIDYLDKEVTALQSLNKFDQNDLSDQNLQLAPAEQPSL